MVGCFFEFTDRIFAYFKVDSWFGEKWKNNQRLNFWSLWEGKNFVFYILVLNDYHRIDINCTIRTIWYFRKRVKYHLVKLQSIKCDRPQTRAVRGAHTHFRDKNLGLISVRTGLSALRLCGCWLPQQVCALLSQTTTFRVVISRADDATCTAAEKQRLFLYKKYVTRRHSYFKLAIILKKKKL